MVSVSVSLWGGGKRHPGFLRAFPIKLGGGGPPHSSLKTSVLKALLSPPPSRAAYPAGSGKAPPTPPASPLRREAPNTPGPRAMVPRGPEKGRAGQGQGEKDLAEAGRQEVRGCTAPHGCTETRG